METLKLVIIGIVQGITELLPVSSSGHILLLSKLFEIDTSSSLLLAFHLGTTLAIILFFRKNLFTNLFSKKKMSFYLKILISSIPAGIIGLLFEDVISEKLRAEWIISVSLIVWGLVMIVVERNKKFSNEDSTKNIENISWNQSILIGLSQSIALIPGTSRSGITTLAGIFSGLNKYIALEYSFILGIPILLGGYLWDCFKYFTSTDSYFSSTTSIDVLNYVLILLITFVVGYISLTVLRKHNKRNWLTVFGIYRIVLGIVILFSLYIF